LSSPCRTTSRRPERRPQAFGFLRYTFQSRGLPPAGSDWSQGVPLAKLRGRLGAPGVYAEGKNPITGLKYFRWLSAPVLKVDEESFEETFKQRSDPRYFRHGLAPFLLTSVGCWGLRPPALSWFDPAAGEHASHSVPIGFDALDDLRVFAGLAGIRGSYLRTHVQKVLLEAGGPRPPVRPPP
jgi:hypothetical protein